MSVMMIFSMSGVSVKAAQLQENNELKTVMVDMKDVARINDIFGDYEVSHN